MKKFLLCFILFISSQLAFAQRDTEHWIAPYHTQTTGYKHALYISTDSVTPFPVNIHNNNTVIGTVNVSKGNPQIFYVNENIIRTNNATDGFKVITKGLYLKGDKPFFATLRIYQGSHGEIVTSKGKAGIGNKFFVTATPQAINTSSNFTAGVLATEDNTSVTVSWTATGLVFQGGTPTGNSHTFTLNKGQSFLFSGLSTTVANRTGFIGAKIVSNKPITLTNGNSNGNFGAISSDGSDLILDQSVPTDRLGNTFGMIKTLSTDPIENPEGAIIVATEDNTEVFVNGSTTPIVTLNEGKWYWIKDTNYIEQGSATASHKNMFISSSKNIYVYQLVSRGSDNATNGFNYIPPLNCFLPRKIDEIGRVTEMPLTDTTSGTPPSTLTPFILKLNILTEAGAVVNVNGAPLPTTQGPFPLPGNSQWVTYAIPNITPGNLTVTSTKAVTAGVNGGYSTAGYGGYFAGFSSIPLISKQTGACVPGIILEVDDSFDSYQWYRNGNIIAGATNNAYSPPTSGNYTVKITMAGCAPVTTPEYKVFTCLEENTKAQIICGGSTTITPTFTNSSQTIQQGSIVIVTPPANGTALVNSTAGTITYTATAGYQGPDSFVYKFCGTEPEFTDCEQVTMNLTISKTPIVIDATTKACYLAANTATGLFNLTNLPVTAETGVVKEYYPSPTDAVNSTNPIPNPANYIAPSGVAFIKVIGGSGCYAIAKVTLIVSPPTPSAILKDKQICMESTTTLDAGPGFTSYQWSTGATTPSISNVSVGAYWVILKTGECFTKQEVKVFPTELPVITSLEVSNNTVTVNVIGGTAPYMYSIDNHNWQSTNVFENVTRGDITVYVRDNNRCKEVQLSTIVPKILNVITPNGDGLNDFLDYSALAGRTNLTFSIYDRYGARMFEGNKDNGYKWDGTIAGKSIPTGNYWFDIRWDDSNSKAAIKYTGWILVKNR